MVKVLNNYLTFVIFLMFYIILFFLKLKYLILSIIYA